MCTACALGKSILRTSYLKIKAEPLQFFERIQGEICGQFIHSSDHIGTSWYLLMHQLDGPICVCYPHKIMHMHDSLLKLLKLEHIIWNF